MTWDVTLTELFDELETEAHGQALAAREDDVEDLARAEYAEVELEARLLGSVGEPVRLELPGGTVSGRLERVGRGCVVVRRTSGPSRPVLVGLRHLLAAHTASSRAVTEHARPLTSRLGLASALRHLALEDPVVLARLSDGRSLHGTVARVGADFVEVVATDGSVPLLVPMAAVVTVEPA